jgi:ABC-2 type transport system ATP-binding protein
VTDNDEQQRGSQDLETIISTHELRKSFPSKKGPVEAVRGVSFEVARGEIFGFLGPNGAGKTTTLRMLTTLLPIDSGTASVAGIATGRENLILQGRLYGGDPASVTRRAQMLMEVLDIGEFADRRVRTYSGGQRRRLDVALGIVHEPDVLFLDEPSTGLDPQNRANLWDHVRSLRERGTTIFLTTHYLEEADALCDRLMIMDHGDIVAEGTPRDLKRQVSGDSVLLSVHDEGGALARALKLVSAEPYVHEVSVEGDRLHLYVEDGSAALPGLLRLLDAERIVLKSISLSEPTLDDVFLHQTGRSLRDAGTGTTGTAA